MASVAEPTPATADISLRNVEQRDARVFLAGLCAFLAIMLGFPAIANLWFSLNDVTFQNLMGEGFIGLTNYAAAITDPGLWDAMGYSLWFALVCTIAQVGIALVLVLSCIPFCSGAPG